MRKCTETNRNFGWTSILVSLVRDIESELEFWNFSKIINVDIERDNKVDFCV